MNEININTMNVTELEALAYRTIRYIEQQQQSLQAINQKINEKGQEEVISKMESTKKDK